LRKGVRLLDLRGLRGSRALIRVAKEARSLASWETLEVLVDDRRTVDELVDWSERKKMKLQLSRSEDYWVLRIRRSGD